MRELLLSVVLSFVMFHTIKAQNFIEGQVTDTDGVPVVAVTVVVKGTNTFAVGDVDGKFRIDARLSPPFTLQFSSIGLIPKEVVIQQLTGKPIKVILLSNNTLEEVIVTARRRKENIQDIPIPMTAMIGAQVENTGAFNVSRLKEMIPTVQFYSSNQRNSALNIRGLGTTFGLTNDGIDPGVGFYVDGVYYARSAATTLDFIDVESIEVLRGPQGTLYGKNTTAGAINITTRKPGFSPVGRCELSYGNYGYIQAKSSVSGPLGKKIAGRLSFTGTQRDGVIYNVARNEHVNDLNNIGVRGQILAVLSKKIELLLAADVSRQRPNGYAQVFAGVAPTLRPAYRQFEQIIADLHYNLPARNPFDRVIDTDTPWRGDQDFGGLSINADFKLGSGTITSTTAWRYWRWGPSNDRDFTGLQALALSQAPSVHQQWSQEVRYAGNLASNVSGVIGLYALGQKLRPDGAQTEECGKDQWRFSQSSKSTLWATPGLLDGYGIKSYPNLDSFSGAIFGQMDWAISPRFHVLPGIRINYDDKKVDFKRVTYGGLQTNDPALLALKNSVYSDQAFQEQIEDTKLSGQMTVSYKVHKSINTYATFSTNFKPVGLNLGGLPSANGQVLTELAVVKPEKVQHLEFGLKSSPTNSATANLTIYNTRIKDYQTLVQTADLAVNRGYLANAEEVRVRGVELEGNLKIGDFLSFYGAAAYTDGKYVSFKNAPPPLEETGGPTFKDISGGELPGISKWAASLGGEIAKPGKLLDLNGKYFLAFDTSYRSSFSSSASPSKYLIVDSYCLLNTRVGFQDHGFTIYLWGRNMLDTNYFELLLSAGGNAGQYAGMLGDPRTMGITIKYSFQRE
ncbi:MAG TPA: TonB-dependent receptor [Prolixibacteraceae bacterium]